MLLVRFQGNYHIFYYIYDGLHESNRLEQYHLNPEWNYRYLRLDDQDKKTESYRGNVKRFKTIFQILEVFDLKDGEMENIFSIISAILNIGEIRFQATDEDRAVVENEEFIEKIGQLLKIDPGKLSWALTNYCLIRKGTAIRRKSSTDEARAARDVFANTLYVRLVHYIVALINNKLSVGTAIL